MVRDGKAGKEGEEKLETANYDEFGCTSHPGVLSNASIPFELYMKVSLVHVHNEILLFRFIRPWNPKSLCTMASLSSRWVLH